jgi:glycosyltransferase involved in cell wall biosynthesis
MRIAVVTTSWPSDPDDAAGHFVRAEARGLERDGHEVVVVTPVPRGAFGWPGAATRIGQRPWRALGAARWVVSARRRIRAGEFDRVVAHWAVPSAWPIAIAARDASIDVVSHGGDVRLLVALAAPARRSVVRRIAGRAERWRFVSESLLEGLLSALDAETRAGVERIARVEPPPLDIPEVRAAIASRRRTLGNIRVAVSVGRLVASKRVERAIEAAARRDDIDSLVIVGDGPERVRLERLAKTLGVDARFVGALARPEALAWIGAADVLLQASAAEGLSTVEREAEALGTPVERL